MTQTQTRPAPPEVADVADRFVALMHAFNRARAKFLAAAQHDVDWSAQVVLKTLANRGPMRSSDLACVMQADPSTVSRQVSALVKEGLLERQADPDDGRASLLALTPAAGDVIADHDQVRLGFFAHLLEGWSERDLRRFAGDLDRFTQAYEAANDSFIAARLNQTQKGSN
jgi:DNA-binding MarR family transcriptional regulator